MLNNNEYINFRSYNNITKVVIGNNTKLHSTDFSYRYNNMRNIKSGSMPEEVTNIGNTYSSCISLTGSPVCGENVTDMSYTYFNCINLTGNPVCGENVTNMSYAYYSCYRLTGSPVCGENVTNIGRAYQNCTNLTGNPACGDKVTDMTYTYFNCTNLTGSPVCGNKVISMNNTYFRCANLYGNMYMYSPNVNNMIYCFYNRNTSNILNIYVLKDSTSMNTLLRNNSISIIGAFINWVNNNGNYYCAEINTYVYPVTNITEARLNNGD